MADRVLFIGWTSPARGAEERALESFNDALGLLGRKQQEGLIEGFDVGLLEPNGDLGGYIIARGSATQISALRNDDDFLQSTINAQLSVDGIRHIEGVTNEGIAHQMEMYQQALAHVPQHA